MKKNEKGTRFSVYFYPEQIEWLDREAKKLNVSRSKFIEMRVLPAELQFLKSRKKEIKNGSVN